MPAKDLERHLGIALHGEDAARIRRAARNLGLTAVELVRRAVKAYVSTPKRPNEPRRPSDFPRALTSQTTFSLSPPRTDQSLQLTLPPVTPK
jgi:hypothetical protein